MQIFAADELILNFLDDVPYVQSVSTLEFSVNSLNSQGVNSIRAFVVVISNLTKPSELEVLQHALKSLIASLQAKASSTTSIALAVVVSNISPIFVYGLLCHCKTNVPN